MSEMVSHPSHYNKDGRKECIVEMEEKYGAEATAIFCLTNAYKYLYRAGDKFGNSANQDVAKAQWYFDYANKLITKYGILAFNGIRIEDTDLYLDIKEMLENEFPKVKLNLPKFDFSHLTEAVRNMNSDFDNIVKDIREQKDNAMAMEFTRCIGELLRNNGVVPKISEYRMENHTENKIEMRYGVSIDELDFSEHDKVFEDKIAKLQEEVGKLNQDNMRLERKCVTKDDEIYRLKKDYKTVSELLGKYQQENESLKQRIAELESENEQLKHDIDKMAESKSEWIDRAVEWQQKCEKLESKETETCEKEPISDECRPSMEWYENRHQSDCIEINRLNTTIDVLIHKVEYLRQFAGME